MTNQDSHDAATAASAQLCVDDVIGHYTLNGAFNDWHYGSIVRDGSELKWVNKAGREWRLIPDLQNNRLLTDKTNPYQDTQQNFTTKVKNGKLQGFNFGSEFFAFNLFEPADIAAMIPLRPAKSRKHEFVAWLTGDALDNTEYEMLFDTGSWTLSVPYVCLNKDKLTVIEKDIKDCWGKPADKVQGQVALKSQDGTTYSIDDYVFFARKNDDGSDAPCDREAPYGNAIMGAFPSVEPGSGLKSLPYALAEKYSKEKGVGLGMGIVSQSDQSYLLLGANKNIITDEIKWRSDNPLWHEELGFCPEAVKGFAVDLTFPEIEQNPTISGSDLMATIDTGAPEMILRLNDQDPQETIPYSEHFTSDGYWKPWGNQDYLDNAKMVTGNCMVTVKFTDDKGSESSYSFEADNALNKVALAKWDSNVPWTIQDPDKPRNRFNLGNMVYRFCPVVFYDIDNKRVGISFSKS